LGGPGTQKQLGCDTEGDYNRNKNGTQTVFRGVGIPIGETSWARGSNKKAVYGFKMSVGGPIIDWTKHTPNRPKNLRNWRKIKRVNGAYGRSGQSYEKYKHVDMGRLIGGAKPKLGWCGQTALCQSFVGGGGGRKNPRAGGEFMFLMVEHAGRVKRGTHKINLEWGKQKVLNWKIWAELGKNGDKQVSLQEVTHPGKGKKKLKGEGLGRMQKLNENRQGGGDSAPAIRKFWWLEIMTKTNEGSGVSEVGVGSNAKKRNARRGGTDL